MKSSWSQTQIEAAARGITADVEHDVLQSMAVAFGPKRSAHIEAVDLESGQPVMLERVEKYPRKRGKRFTKAQREHITDMYRAMSESELRVHHKAASTAALERGLLDLYLI